MRKTFTLTSPFSIIFLFFLQLFPGSDAYSAHWTSNPFEAKVFVENKGQFDGRDQLSGSHILYGTDNAGTQIYFTAKGLTYRFDKVEVPGGDDNEGEERPEADYIDSRFINVEFLNANPGVQVIAEDMAHGYFNYTERSMAKPVYHASSYKKIIYKNIYNNIDIEYTFHKDHGIKYAIILHPGADVSKVMMRYTGTNGITNNEAGDILIATDAGEIIDHAPVTYYASDNSSISSGFQHAGNVVSFKLDNYDNTRNVVIDPWSVFPSFGGTYNRSLNVKSDPFGNVFGYGSYNPCKLVKYNSSGALQWSVNSPYGIWPGGLAPDNQGNVYISGLYGVTKYDSTGTVIWDSTYSPSIECWRLSFDPSFAHLYLAGSLHASLVYEINTSDGSIINSNNIGGAEEIRAMCVGPDNNLYTVIASSGALTAATPALTNIYNASSGGLLLYYGNYGNPPTNGSSHTCPVNDITADNNYIYCFDGRILDKINISTGATIASKTVTGVSSSQLYGGVAVDGCGNIYVGSINKVVEYDSLLNQVTTFTTSGAVYDVYISAGGTILASGEGFIATLGTVPSQCLNNVVLPPVADFTASDTSFCTGDCVNFSNTSQNATAYQWFFAGGSPSSGVAVSPSNICYYSTGNYDVELIASNSGGSDTLKFTSYIAVRPTPPTPVISRSNDTLYSSFDSSYVSYQWYKDTVVLAGETNSYLVISTGGNYNVKVSNQFGCEVGSGINVILGENEFAVFGFPFTISPNPVKNQFTIHNSQFAIKTVEIYNVLGEKVFPSSIFHIPSSLIVDVSLLPSGIYFIILNGENEQRTGKFVKE